MTLGLRTRSALLVAAYTLALEGGVLAWFYYSGQRAIERRSRQEVRTHAALARAALERSLADAVAELSGLRSQLLLYPFPTGPKHATLKVIEELVLAFPQRYAEIAFLDRDARRVYSVRAVSELTAIYPVVDVRPACLDASDDLCAAPASSAGLLSGPREELVRIVLPLGSSGRAALVGYLHAGSLFESAARLAAPPGVSVLAANRRGFILHAADLSLLRRYLRDSAPHLEPAPEGSARALPGRVVHWERLEQPQLTLAVEKDQRPELAELRLQLLSAALFTSGFTFLALLGVWALTGRMASGLRHVSEVANSVAAGDFSQRIALRRTDELGVLIDSFNAMTARLEESYRALRDVNLRLEAKIAELTRTRRRLSQKQRLALLGEAISTISHEIQNRIGGASVWVQNLERFGPQDGNARLCLEELKASLASFRDMLVHFKRFYREPQIARQPVPVKTLVEASVARAGAELAAKRLSVVENLPGSALCLDVDPMQMTDALVNLLLNAAYFSPERGVIEIALRREDASVILSVRDQGPGVQAKAKLFQPFFTTKPAGGGLGLAIVRNIVHAHSGRVRGFNHPEGGACFEIRLPAPETTQP